MQRILFACAILCLLALASLPVPAQADTQPFILPIDGEPGPSGWLFGQAYGNTTGAYNFGDLWYSAGQGLHFGVDIAAPCGTPLLAVADGEVAFADNLGFGAGPHNLILYHPESNLTTLYGHLLEPPRFIAGQTVQQGDVVGYSGDPDLTCASRPHLHFEVRSGDFRTALNPIPYIDANWHSLASIGAYGYPLFQQDMNNPRRWMSLENQPDVAFGGRRVNDYVFAWPLRWSLRPPENPPLARDLGSLPESLSWSLREIGTDGCCWGKWWHSTDPDTLYVIDGANGERATLQRWSAATGALVEVIGPAPPAVTSPDGRYAVFNNPNYVTIRADDGSESVAYTGGTTPAISTDNSKLVWTAQSSARVPGQAAPPSTVWVAPRDGSDPRRVVSDAGLSARWLDADRILITQAQPGRITAISVYDTRDDTRYDLGAFRNLRGLSVAPGGGRLAFMLNWQDDPAADGIFLLETTPGAMLEKLPWFGGWRWRDADSLYYLPLTPDSPHHTLAYYHIPTGTDRILITPETLPFTIMNGDWEVSADGRRIVFHNAGSGRLSLLEME